MTMNKVKISSFLTGVTISLLGSISPAFAETLVLPAGIACQGFDLKLDISSDGGTTRVLKDKKGFIRTINPGKGNSILYTNVTSGKTFSTKSNGSVFQRTTDPATGNYRLQITGHSLLILFPTDVPPGPSTTLYDGGRIVLLSDAADNFILKEESGRKVDVCAILSQ
jgi:hypothetical protein